ncbi:MAG TPA: chloride channel protein [Candidatus Ligilactobacillus excrementavium]|nr:chloride channel protein [Candidatus Ligilactobacillus excrementavium]
MEQAKKKVKINSAHLSYILKGVLIGAIAGVVVGAFRWLIEKSLGLWKHVFQMAHQQPLYLLVIGVVLVLIGLVIGKLVTQQPHISGSGIPEIEGQLAGKFKFNWWAILWRKFVAGVLAIGSGLFLGREGPSIQLGGAVGQGIADMTEDSKRGHRVLIASGAAAGLSAAFNAPIAGTLFILEEVYHNFSPLVWMGALSASITADVVSMNVFGLETVLHVGVVPGLPLKYYWHLLILGVVLGLLGYFYQRTLLQSSVWYHKLFGRIPRAYHGLIALFLLVPVGYFFTNTLGGGNVIIIKMAQVDPLIISLFLLFVLRFVFSMVSYGSGLPGGIFLPILTLGAVIGMLYGAIALKFNLLPSKYMVDLLVFAMAGYFAGIGKAPFTAILLVTEMVGSLQHLVPLALTSLVAYIVVDLLGGAPIYESLLGRMTVKQKLHVISGKNDQVELPVFDDSRFVGQQVRDINWPSNTLLIGVRRGEKTAIPNGDTLIHPGDTLVVLVDNNFSSDVRDQLQKLNRPLEDED